MRKEQVAVFKMRYVIALIVVGAAASNAAAEQTYRMHDGVTAFVVNRQGKPFTVSLDVRDINIFESGPREVLVKVYDPDGRTLVREVIPDDGVTQSAYQHPTGAWDHEAWYYAWTRMQGEAPMIRWSAFSEPPVVPADRLLLAATLASGRTPPDREPDSRSGEATPCPPGRFLLGEAITAPP